jgi:hypothetical protein
MKTLCVALLLALLLCGCNATKQVASTPPPTSNVACKGTTCAWEITGPGVGLADVNFTMSNGSQVVDGFYFNSAGPAVAPVVAANSGSETWSLTGTVTGNQIAMDFSAPSFEAANPGETWDYHFTGTIDPTNNTMSGTATWCCNPSTGQPGQPQPFSGAEITTALPASFSGTIATFSNACLVAPGGSNCPVTGGLIPSLGNDTVQATFAVDNNFNVTATLVLSGVDNGTFTLSGPMFGNAMQLSGMVGTQQVTLAAYFNAEGLDNGVPRSLSVFQLPYPTSAATKYSTYGNNGTLNPTN